MALIVGHSQTKYLRDYLNEDYEVFAFPGFRIHQFHRQQKIFDEAPFFSVVVVVVGANDIGRLTPRDIVADIDALVHRIQKASPSAKIVVSEILPRARSLFRNSRQNNTFLRTWNDDANEVNLRLRRWSRFTPDVTILHLSEMYASHGPNRRYLSKDGLHLSCDGHFLLADNIISAVNERKKATPPIKQASQ